MILEYSVADFPLVYKMYNYRGNQYMHNKNLPNVVSIYLYALSAKHNKKTIVSKNPLPTRRFILKGVN